MNYVYTLDFTYKQAMGQQFAKSLGQVRDKSVFVVLARKGIGYSTCQYYLTPLLGCDPPSPLPTLIPHHCLVLSVSAPEYMEACTGTGLPAGTTNSYAIAKSFMAFLWQPEGDLSLLSLLHCCGGILIRLGCRTSCKAKVCLRRKGFSWWWKAKRKGTQWASV